MTKKDFIYLADMIRNSGPTDGNGAYGVFSRSAIATLADFCASQNPMFNRSRWLGYIRGENGPSGGAVK